jgi:hypothetical protein
VSNRNGISLCSGFGDNSFFICRLLSAESTGSVEPSEVRSTLCDRVDSDRDRSCAPGFIVIKIG